MLEDINFSHISSCLFAHYPVDAFVQTDSYQVILNTSNDTKFGPEKWVAVFVFAHEVGKFSMEFCKAESEVLQRVICYLAYKLTALTISSLPGDFLLDRKHIMLFSIANNSCHDNFTTFVWVKLYRVIQGLTFVA